MATLGIFNWFMDMVGRFGNSKNKNEFLYNFFDSIIVSKDPKYLKDKEKLINCIVKQISILQKKEGAEITFTKSSIESMRNFIKEIVENENKPYEKRITESAKLIVDTTNNVFSSIFKYLPKVAKKCENSNFEIVYLVNEKTNKKYLYPDAIKNFVNKLKLDEKVSEDIENHIRNTYYIKKKKEKGLDIKFLILVGILILVFLLILAKLLKMSIKELLKSDIRTIFERLKELEGAKKIFGFALFFALMLTILISGIKMIKELINLLKILGSRLKRK